jgi:hypothetical protein
MKELNNLIKNRPYLIWHTKNYDKLSQQAIIEAVLNYGSFDDFKKVVKILGIKKTATIFKKGASQKRCNYRPEIKNYFLLYFKKYA